MIVVEVVMRMKAILIGPFDSQRQALHWVGELIEANPAEKTFISVNDTGPNSIRVYMGELEEPVQNFFPPKLDLFQDDDG